MWPCCHRAPLNTNPDDPSGRLQPLAGTASRGESQFHWSACLDPALRLGLDFDVAARGAFVAQLSSTRPVSGSLHGRLVLIGPGEAVPSCQPVDYAGRPQLVPAELDELPEISLGMDAVTRIETAVLPNWLADYVPYQQRAQLVLELTFMADQPLPQGNVRLQPGAQLSLPLLEYRETEATFASDVDDGAFTPIAAPKKETSGLSLVALSSALLLIGSRGRRGK